MADSNANISKANSASSISFHNPEQLVNYEDLTLEEKFLRNISSLRSNRAESIRRITELSEKENYEDATLWLADNSRDNYEWDKLVELYKNY
ncbi:unnamed protein product [Blepharisma stoltei]|uniref:Uncharacterized protein n=1 Tax=Blepharisma stoltei TaxID=1481888 RepID=A0AAU9K7J5_9CILI|nr:unnamed protein product [Blepharisma stoltei]